MVRLRCHLRSWKLDNKKEIMHTYEEHRLENSLATSSLHKMECRFHLEGDSPLEVMFERRVTNVLEQGPAGVPHQSPWPRLPPCFL